MDALPQSALRVLTALVKAQVKRALGDETLQALAGALTDLGHDALAERLQAVLADRDRQKALAQALARADACAQRRLATTRLREMAGHGGLPLRNLPQLLAALKALPEDDLDETRLQDALTATLARDWRLSPEQAAAVADLYLTCLREALLEVETDALRTLGRAILRTEAVVQRIEDTVHRVEAAIKQWQQRQTRSIHIQGNVSQAVLITGDHNVVQVFLRAVKVDHRSRVRRFLQTYLGTPDRPVPFGGRAEDMARLSQWLEEDDRPYFFLHAPAGRGKSALLSRWATVIAQQDEWAVVFVPISLRFETHRPEVYLHLLAQGLRHFYEPDQPELSETNPEVLLSIAAEYLERSEPPPGKGKLLVVLDGLDEALWRMGRQPTWEVLFPKQRLPHLKVVVSARVLNDTEAQRWLRQRLRWRPGLAHTHRLAHLSLAGVREVLAQMQVPLDQLSRDTDLVQALYRLTDQGDPLLVGLYAQDLLDTLETQGLEAARQRAYRIGQLVGRGYTTFVESYWWPELRRWWREQGLVGDPEIQARALLDLLALARGPIPEGDVRALARRALQPDQPDLDPRAWEGLGRIVLRQQEGDHRMLTFAHPRLREYFVERLRTQDPERRRAFEAHYRAWVEEAMHRIAHADEAVPDASSYVLQYALDHLADARLETLLPVVTRPGWHRTRAAVEGSYEGYLNDVHAIWHRATQANEAALAGRRAAAPLPADDSRLPTVGLELRCALIEASIHSLAGNLPPELPALLVENGRWTPAQALAHVRQKPDGWEQAKALAALASHLPEGLRAEALDAAREIESEWYHAEALAALASHLPEEQRAQALAEALVAARGIESERYRAKVLAALAPHLPEGQREQVLAEALDAARGIEGVWPRAWALTALAPHLPEGLLAEALVKARGIEDADARVRALAALGPYLPEEQRARALAEALAAARGIEDEGARAYALAALVPHLPEGQRARALAEALAAARGIEGVWPRAWALAALAPVLARQAPAMLAEALAAARGIGDERGRAEVLTALAPHLPEGLLAEALDAAREIGDEEYRARALAGLAPHLPEEQRAQALAEALDAARGIEDEEYRAKALAALASHLPEGKREQALAEGLDAARTIGDADDRARALAGLAPHLPEGQRAQALAEALAAARGIRWADDRARALAALAPHLPADLRAQALAEALAAAREIESAWARVDALVALAPHLPEGLLAEALDAAREIEDADNRVRALAALAPHLPEGLLAEALDAAWGIEGVWPRAWALTALAPHLPEGLLAEALDAAREIGDEEYRARALAVLGPHLPEEQRAQALAEALAAARGIEDEGARAYALTALAPHLPEGQRARALAEALAAARRIEGVWPRAWALTALAPHLPEGLLAEALAAAREIEDEGARARALVALAPHLPEGKRAQVLAEALAAARGIEDADDRARALAGLAPHLPEGLLAEALAAARGIGDEGARARALTALAPHLPEGLLVEALAAARGIGDEGDRAEALAALAPHLPEDLRAQALAEALAAARGIEHEGTRARALVALAPHLPARLLVEALAAARGIEWEGDRAYALAALAPHLPEGLLAEALAAARGIEWEGNRAYALAALAPRLAELPLPALYPLWRETLPVLARRTRKDLLADIRALHPVIAKLGGPAAVVETAQAILDVAEWWP